MKSLGRGNNFNHKKKDHENQKNKFVAEDPEFSKEPKEKNRS